MKMSDAREFKGSAEKYWGINVGRMDICGALLELYGQGYVAIVNEIVTLMIEKYPDVQRTEMFLALQCAADLILASTMDKVTPLGRTQ